MRFSVLTRIIISKTLRISYNLRKSLFLLRCKYNCRSKDYIYADISKLNMERLLVIAPHADDELIGAHSVINNSQIANDIKILLCSYTGSNVSEKNKKIRKLEFLNYCKKSKVKGIVLKDDVCEGMRKIIEEYNPTHIMITPLLDSHPEHREVNIILQKILANMKIHPILIWYQVSMPLSLYSINYISKMPSELQQKKWETFESVYISQSRLQTKRFKFEERIIGILSGASYSCEPYIVLSYDEWNRAVCLFNDKMGHELDRIKKYNLESVFSYVYKKSKMLYRQIQLDRLSKK